MKGKEMESEEVQALKAEIERLKAKLNEVSPPAHEENKAAVMVTGEERLVVRFKGVNRAARALGVSPTHLTYILHGNRAPGPKLAEKMTKLGIPFPGAAAQ